MLDEPSKEVRLVQLKEADVLHILAETLAALLKPYFWFRPCWFEQTRQEREPWPNFLDGSSRAAGDPCCFLGCNELKGGEDS